MRKLRADEIEVRIGQTKKNKAGEVTGFSLLLYKTSRTDMTLLDEEYGAMNWKCRFETVGNSMFCYISVWDESKKEWIEKGNCGSETAVEAEKGLASDAFKRAGTMFGIGRELYNSPFIWIQGECDKFANYTVDTIEYEDDNICHLVISNKGKEIYRYGRHSGVKQNLAKQNSSNRSDTIASQVAPQPKKEPQITEEEYAAPIDYSDPMLDAIFADSKKQPTDPQTLSPKEKLTKIRQACAGNSELIEWINNRLKLIGQEGRRLEDINEFQQDYIFQEVVRRGLA